ncbi:MAG: polysaccharide biosynthesis protein [Mariniphaga sp.]|nr:polysaccharide biosynthesis protein [Mariniphaga sp.]
MAIRTPIKKLGQNALVYGIGNVLSKLAAFLLIPIYTRYLTTSDIGIMALLEMVELFMITVLPMGLVGAIWRRLPASGIADKKCVISSAFWFIQLISFIVLILLSSTAGNIAAFLKFGENGGVYLLITAVNVFLFIGGQFILWMFQYEQQPYKYLILSITQFVGILLLSIYFIIYRGMGLQGLLFSKTIMFGIIFILSTIYVVKTAFVLPRLSTLIPLLKYGIPLIIMALVTPVLTMSDRFILNLFVSIDQIGIYSVAYKFGMLINIVLIAPIQRGWSPIMYKMGINKDTRHIYKDILFYYGVLGSFLFLIISFLADDILRLFTTPAYLVGAKYIPIITYAYYLSGFRNFLIAGAMLKDKTISIGKSGVLAIIFNLISNYLLIKYFNIAGAAWATLISYAFLVIMIYFVSQKASPLNWGWNRMIKLTMITIFCFILVNTLVFFIDSIPKIILTIFGLSLFILLGFCTRIVGRREIKGIKEIAKHLFNR